jgi:hypothetical protein
MTTIDQMRAHISDLRAESETQRSPLVSYFTDHPRLVTQVSIDQQKQVSAERRSRRRPSGTRMILGLTTGLR